MSSVVDTNITVKLNDIEMAVYGMASTKQQYFTPTYYDEYDCTVSPAIKEKPIYRYFRNNNIPEYDTIYQTDTDYKWVDEKGYFPIELNTNELNKVIVKMDNNNVELKYYEEKSNENTTITIYGLSDNSKNYSGTIKIPAKIGDYNVTKITDGAFRGSNISFITFEKQDNIVGIGMGAFYNCSDLTNITIPEKMKIISHHTFENCTNLTTVLFPLNKNKISNISVIDSWAFANCAELSSLKIPYGIRYIGQYSFEKCYKIGNVEIPASVKVIKNSAFNMCWLYNAGTIKFYRTEDIDYDANLLYNDPWITIHVTEAAKEMYEECFALFRSYYRDHEIELKTFNSNEE